MADAERFPTVPGIEIRRVIGRGGFATVYSGFQAAFNRLVAVKVLENSELDGDARRRFDRECQVMGALSNHPYIVTLYVAGYTSEERPYMVMPFVTDGTLADRIRAAGAMPWDEVVPSGVRLAGALATAHAAGVLHRDIKPANVLRAEYGDLLGDFGIARIAGGHETKSGVITASIAHAPPEVLDGDASDARSDVYSLGSTLYEALAGKAPFAPTAQSVGMGPIIRRIFMEDPPPFESGQVPAAVDEVIRRAMSKARDDRYATAAEFGEALQASQRAMSVGPTDMLVLGTAAVEAVREVPDVPDTATVIFDAADVDAPDLEPIPDQPIPDEPVPPFVEAASATVMPSAPVAPDGPPAGGFSPAPTPVVAPTIAAPAATPPPTFADGPVAPVESERSNGGLVAAGIAGLVLLLLVVAGVFFLNRGSDDPEVADGPDVDVPSTADVETPVTASVEATTTVVDPGATPLVLPAGDPVEIQLLNPRIQSEALQELVNGFEAANPDISVEIVEEGNYSTSLDLVVSGAQQPDVALLSDKAVQTMLDKVDFLSVQDFIDRDDFDASVLLANAADTYSTRDGLVAMPFNVAMPMLYANGDLLAEAGVDLAPGAAYTTAELLDQCSLLADIVPTCLEYRLIHFLYIEMITNSGGRLFDTNGFEGSANAAVFDDEIGRAAFDFVTETVTDGVAVPFRGDRLFDTGGAAFFFDTSSGLGSIDRANDAADQPVELIPLGIPHVDGAQSSGVIPGGGALWILDRGDERRAIASWLLVEYLSQLPQLLEFHSASGFAPPRIDAATDEGFLEFWSRKPVFRGAYDELVAAATTELPNQRDGRAGPFHQIDGRMTVRISEVWNGDLEPDEAFDALIDDVNTLLDEYDPAG